MKPSCFKHAVWPFGLATVVGLTIGCGDSSTTAPAPARAPTVLSDEDRDDPSLADMADAADPEDSDTAAPNSAAASPGNTVDTASAAKPDDSTAVASAADVKPAVEMKKSPDGTEPAATPTDEPVASPAATKAAAGEKPIDSKPADSKPADAKPADAPSAAPVAVAAADGAKKAAAAAAAAAVGPGKAGADDWSMWGGDMSRNMANKATGISIDFEPATDPKEGKNILWTAPLGSQTYGNPVVAGGRVYVGTNNGGEYRPKHKGDRGVVLCFDEKTGEFLWQLTREKLPQGRVNDWPEQGICSTPCIEGDRMYVVSNRCELLCLDVAGFGDDENDGPYTHEEDNEKQDADIIWAFDMIEELGVFPHNLATSSPVIYGDTIFITTSNGVDEAHLEVPAPRSPSFVAVNKNTGELVWEDTTPSLESGSPEPFNTILHGQWSSPAIGVVNGKAQVYMPGGDGWLYALDAATGEHIWKFDLNPKESVWELGGAGSRNAIIATPVVVDTSVLLAVGQDPEHGGGVGHLYRIDATKTGDISPQIEDGEGSGKYIDNPNSGQIWQFGGEDTDGSVTGEERGLIFRRTMSTVSVHDGLVYAADLDGFVHCVDFQTGKRYWEYDTFAAIWGSPLYVDGKVLIGDEDGELCILQAGKEKKVLAEKSFNSSIYSTPTIANGVMFVSDRSRLYAIKLK